MAAVACALAPTTANAQIGGGIGIGGGGVNIDITVGDPGGPGGTDGGAAPSGAPLPLLGGTLLGHAALIGAGYFGWRRRQRNQSVNNQPAHYETV